MWGQLRQVQQQQQQQQAAKSSASCSSSSSAPTAQAPAPTAAVATITAASAASVPAHSSASASVSKLQKNRQEATQEQTQLAQEKQQPDASCSAKTIGHSNVTAAVQNAEDAASASINANATASKNNIGGEDAADTSNDKWGFDDDPFFDDDNNTDEKREQDTDKEDSGVSPDKSGRRRRFATLKDKSKTTTTNKSSRTGAIPTTTNVAHDRRRSSLLSINEDTGMHDADEDDDDDGGAGGVNNASWPAMIDFESNQINPADEFADAADNLNDSSRSLGSTSRASREEKRKLDRDLALIRNEQKVDAKSMNVLNKTVVVPTSTGTAKDTPGKTPKVKNSKNVDDLADNDTAAAIVGGGIPSGGGGRMQTRSQTASNKTTGTTSMNDNEKEKEDEEELIPPSSSTTSSRRLGASAGTRSAVKAARQQHTQKQKAVAKEEMKLAERKFAAAVQKIAADDDADCVDVDDSFGDSNWDFDDGDNDADATPETTTNSPGSDVHRKLVQYLSSLSGIDTPLVQSLNSLLEAELNTDENCAELIHYYTTRPQLLDYTIDTELSRMDYLVITPYDQYIEKDDIKLYVESTSDRIDDTESLILRASNQSLLADCVAALTGDDRLIRPSMMVTAVAESCKFELNLVGGDGANRGVAVMSDLVLWIPFADGEGESSRIELGKVKARVLFVPELQQLEYSIVQAIPLISPDDERLIAAAASLERDLAELGIGGAAMAQGPHVDQLSRTAHDDLRDQFLATVSTGASGLSSALREFDSVTNVSGKLGWLKAAMPSLPSADVIAQAESQATSSAHAAPPTTHHQGSFPRPTTANTNRGHGFLDRLADEGQHASVPQKAPPQPGTRAMGFLDRLANELEAPDQQSTKFPRPTPPGANIDTNANHFDDNERFPRPPVQVTQPDHQFPPQPSLTAQAPAPTAGKAPLIGGFLVRGLANAAKGLAGAAVAADEFAEASYTRPNQEKDEEVKFYRQTNVERPAPKVPVPDVQPTNQEHMEARPIVAPVNNINNASDGKISANVNNIRVDSGNIDDSGGWSDDDGIGINDKETQNDLEGTPNAPAAPAELRIKQEASLSSEKKPEPSFRSFADRLSDAAEKSTAAVESVGAVPELQTFPRPVQNVPPAASAAPASISGASVSTCDGSYQFVSMKSLQDELPEPKDWLAVEAVDAVDEKSGVIPTRSRWQPRRMRASKC